LNSEPSMSLHTELPALLLSYIGTTANLPNLQTLTLGLRKNSAGHKGAGT